MACGAGGHATADRSRVHDHNLLAAGGQMIRHGQPGDAGADHAHVDRGGKTGAKRSVAGDLLPDGLSGRHDGSSRCGITPAPDTEHPRPSGAEVPRPSGAEVSTFREPDSGNDRRWPDPVPFLGFHEFHQQPAKPLRSDR